MNSFPEMETYSFIYSNYYQQIWIPCKAYKPKLEILTRTTKGRGRNSEYNNIFLQLKEYINMWKSIIIFHDHK